MGRTTIGCLSSALLQYTWTKTKKDLCWASHHKAKVSTGNHELYEQLLEVIREGMGRRNLEVCQVKGYTQYSTMFDDTKVVFHASLWCQGGPWYDWCYV